MPMLAPRQPAVSDGVVPHLDVGTPVTVIPKSPLQSTAVWGLFIMVLNAVLQHGVSKRWFPQVMSDAIGNAVVEVVTWIVGAALVIIGRWDATRPLGFSSRTVRMTVKSFWWPLIPFLGLIVIMSGCTTSASYSFAVKDEYPVGATRLDQMGSTTNDASALRTAASATKITYDVAATAWSVAAPTYRRLVQGSTTLSVHRRSDWLKWADVMDKLNADEAQYEHKTWPPASVPTTPTTPTTSPSP